MPKRPVEKRFDVCDEHGEVLAFRVALVAFNNGHWPLDVIYRLRLGYSTKVARYQVVRVQ